MTNTQKTVIAGLAIVLVGVFMVSDFKWLMPKEDAPKKGNGSANASGDSDPYMMLEVNESNFPNATGKCGCLSVNDLTKRT